MSVTLDHFHELLKDCSPSLRHAIEQSFSDISQNLSTHSLQRLLTGAVTLDDLGKHSAITEAYLKNVPQAALCSGEDIIDDCISLASDLSPLVSRDVISLFFEQLPRASVHLNDSRRLQEYFRIIYQLATTTPRALQPLLTHSDELLAKLTLDGLKFWVDFGVNAYRRDYRNLTTYFNLESKDSLAILQKKRRGTLFIHVQRGLGLYLRALWGCGFTLQPVSTATPGFIPYIENNVLHVPDAIDTPNTSEGLALYRATAAHMAAHICYSRGKISTTSLNNSQMFFVGLVEDARIEYQAVETFPGLKKIWGEQLKLKPNKHTTHPSLIEIEKIAQMLLDDELLSDNEALNTFSHRFHTDIKYAHADHIFSLNLGLELYNIFSSYNVIPSLPILENMHFSYRDDNRSIWAGNRGKHGNEKTSSALCIKQTSNIIDNSDNADDQHIEGEGIDETTSSLTEVSSPTDEEDVASTETNDQLDTRKKPTAAYHYHEWDYHAQLHLPEWTTLNEHRPLKGDPDFINNILAQNKPAVHRIKQIVDSLAPSGIQRIRKLEDVNELDLNAAIDAMVSIRLGKQPDPRITQRRVLKRRDLSVLVLLDLSESTNDKIGDSEKTVLELTREASTLVATAIDGIGDPFAIHGFSSNGRHDVKYYRFKDFKQHFDDNVKANLAGMKGELSTRMGCAIRHAGHHLFKQPEHKKLLLIVTDGEPADIDERDPLLLHLDTKKAVEELNSQGILSYCLTLDPLADSYVQRIFGRNNYTVIDHVNRLPERLPMLFASLTS